MKIAITGHNGFLGKHLAARLEKEKIEFETYDHKKYDLLNPLSLKEFISDKNIVFHLAALNRDTNFNLLNTNAMGTASIMEAMLLFNPKAKIIFASSYQADSQKNIYGLSKKLAEEIIEKYANLFGIQSIVFRISNIFGPGCKPYYNSVIATFIDQIQNGKPLSINGDGTQKRDFIYVDDVVDAFMKAASYLSQDMFENFDICSGKEYSLNKIIKELEVITKKSIAVIYNKNAQTGIKEASITNNKAREKLGWQPKTTFRSGLKKIVENY